MPTFSSARRVLLGFAVAALLANGGLAPTQVAAADINTDVEHCYLQLEAPSKVAIKSPYRAVDLQLYDQCGFATYVSIDLYGPQGWDDIFIFDGQASDSWNVYDWQTPGTYDARLSSAYNWHHDDVAWMLEYVDTSITVKYGSKSTISAKRSGKKVTLRVESKSYSTSAEKYKAWNASKAEIQYRTNDGWEHLKWVKLKGGKANYTYSKSTKREYRFVTRDSTTRFGASSSATRR